MLFFFFLPVIIHTSCQRTEETVKTFPGGQAGLPAENKANIITVINEQLTKGIIWLRSLVFHCVSLRKHLQSLTFLNLHCLHHVCSRCAARLCVAQCEISRNACRVLNAHATQGSTHPNSASPQKHPSMNEMVSCYFIQVNYLSLLSYIQ